MSRALAGVRARRGPLLSLAAMTTVVTAGAVTVLGFGAQAGTSPWLALPLLVVGALAVPGAGRELAVVRRAEIGLARLRGVHGRSLVVLLLGEPLLAIVAGALLGVLLGLGGTWVSTRVWLAEPTGSLPGETLPVVAGVVLVGVVAVLAGMAGATREPLSDQVSIVARTKPATTVATFGSVLILVAAVIAVYRSGRGADPDWVVLAGPALVGLAAGQCTVWLMRAVAKVATARTSGSALPAFLATRRIGRTADGGTSLRLLVAAGAVATLAATAAVGVGQWSDESARLTTGAPTRVGFDGQAEAALALSEQVDPEGRHLMAAVLVPDTEPERRRAFVDVTRFDAVASDFFEGTGAADVPGSVDTLAVERPAPATGDRLHVAAAPFAPRVAGTPADAVAALQVTFDYVTATGSSRSASVLVRAGDRTRDTEFDDCGDGCVVRRLEVETGVAQGGEFFVLGETGFDDYDGRRRATLTTLEFAGADLLDADWQVAAGDRPVSETGRVRRTDAGLVVSTGRGGAVRADEASLAATLPVLATPGLAWEGEDPQVDSPGGDQLTADVVADYPALPLVGGAGLLGDLRTALYGSSPTVPAADVMILAGAGTPAAMIDALVDDGGTVSDVGAVRRDADLETGAVAASVYTLTAGCCLAVALLALLAAGSRQRAAYRRDVAALRVVGVSPRQIRSAGNGELALTAVVAVVAGVGSGLLASALLLRGLPLADVPEFAVPLEPVSSVLPALGVGLVLAVIVVVVTGRGRRFDPELTRPSMLREEQWPDTAPVARR